MATNPMWNAILRWSLKQHDGTRPTDVKPMLEEDRKWLEKVMDEMVVDEVARMRLIIETLKIPEDLAILQRMYDSHELQEILFNKDHKKMNDEEKEKKASATFSMDQVLNLVITKKKEILEEMNDLVDRIDMAKNLDKIGGFTYIIQLLESKHPSLQWRAAQVFANVVQNNIYCQEAALKHNSMHRIIQLFKQFNESDEPSEDEQKVVFKALTATSCFIRNFQPALMQFVQADGMKLVLGILTSDKANIRMKKKITFLLCYLLDENQNTTAAHAILSCNTIPTIIRLMFNTKSMDVSLREYAIQVMILICKNGGNAEIKHAKYNVISLVNARQAEITALVNQDDIDQCEDEANLLTEFLDVLQNFVYVPPASKATTTTTTTITTTTTTTTTTTDNKNKNRRPIMLLTHEIGYDQALD